jgi:hypothetical protein
MRSMSARHHILLSSLSCEAQAISSQIQDQLASPLIDHDPPPLPPLVLSFSFEEISVSPYPKFTACAGCFAFIAPVFTSSLSLEPAEPRREKVEAMYADSIGSEQRQRLPVRCNSRKEEGVSKSNCDRAGAARAQGDQSGNSTQQLRPATQSIECSQ